MNQLITLLQELIIIQLLMFTQLLGIVQLELKIIQLELIIIQLAIKPPFLPINQYLFKHY